MRHCCVVICVNNFGTRNRQNILRQRDVERQTDRCIERQRQKERDIDREREIDRETDKETDRDEREREVKERCKSSEEKQMRPTTLWEKLVQG